MVPRLLGQRDEGVLEGVPRLVQFGQIPALFARQICDLCRQTAPDNFERNEDDGYSYVSKQPENEDEEQACRDAIEECPVEAIGEDG